MHFCADEIAALSAAQVHVHCVICWVKAGWQWVKCRVLGHVHHLEMPTFEKETR